MVLTVYQLTGSIILYGELNISLIPITSWLELVALKLHRSCCRWSLFQCPDQIRLNAAFMTCEKAVEVCNLQ